MIDDPPTLQDSIFAIIDLEHCYLQMGIDTSLKSSSHVGRMPHYKLQNVKAHHKHRDELLALLLKQQVGNDSIEEEIEAIESSKSNELLQNTPNPFSGQTTIRFKITNEKASVAEVKIYDYTGKELKSVFQKVDGKGEYDFIINLSEFPNGVYFYSLYVNGNLADTKKMVLQK